MPPNLLRPSGRRSWTVWGLRRRRCQRLRRSGLRRRSARRPLATGGQASPGDRSRSGPCRAPLPTRFLAVPATPALTSPLEPEPLPVTPRAGVHLLQTPGGGSGSSWVTSVPHGTGNGDRFSGRFPTLGRIRPRSHCRGGHGLRRALLTDNTQGSNAPSPRGLWGGRCPSPAAARTCVVNWPYEDPKASGQELVMKSLGQGAREEISPAKPSSSLRRRLSQGPRG